jgi:hypothetical protein
MPLLTVSTSRSIPLPGEPCEILLANARYVLVHVATALVREPNKQRSRGKLWLETRKADGDCVDAIDWSNLKPQSYATERWNELIVKLLLVQQRLTWISRFLGAPLVQLHSCDLCSYGIVSASVAATLHSCAYLRGTEVV